MICMEWTGSWLVHDQRKNPNTVVIVSSRKDAFKRAGLDDSQYPRPEIIGDSFPSYSGKGVRILPYTCPDDEIAVYEIPLKND